MSPDYFSDRELGPRPRTEETLGEAAWGGIVAIIIGRANDGSFGLYYPASCPDGHVTCGTNVRTLSLAVAGEVPGITWPLDHTSVPPTIAILDLTEFCHRSVAKPIQGSYHSFFEHYHLDFDREQGREEYREDINRIFARNGLAYELSLEGKITRLGPEGLREALRTALFCTSDSELDAMLETARKKFLDPSLVVRKEALERLWDAWERLKTLEIPGAGSKKASMTQLLDKAASEPKFRELLEEEAKALTKVGNQFQIRHTETDKTPLVHSEHVDYLFHRLFSLIRLLLRMTGRGG